MRKREIFESSAARREAIEFYRRLVVNRQVVAKTGHNSNTNTQGGYLVPDELAATIENIAESYGMFPSFSRNYTMKRDLLRIPRRSDAASFYFTAEGETAAESSVDFQQVNHATKKVMAFLPVSNDFLEDTVNAAEDITLAFGQGYAELIDNVGFNGDASEDDGGMMGLATLLEDGAHAGAINAQSGHDTFAEIDTTDLTNLVAALPTRAATNAAWYCSHFGAAKTFYRLAAGAGGIGRNAQGEPTFWNWPIRTSPVFPAVDTTLANKAMLLFGDLRLSSSYALRRGLEIGASALGLTWAYDVTKFRAKARFSLLHTDIGDGSTVGAMCALIGQS